jgi:predicted flap endonuclease-1-like 5' DNA nuclease
MFLLMLAALLLGLLLGWILWGHLRGRIGDLQAETARLRSELDSLKAELDACGRARAEVERRLREADAALTSARARTAPAAQPAAALVSAPVAKTGAPKKPATAKKTAAPKVVAAPVKPDNLRRMIGIGPVNEKKLNGLGIRTFAQIAAWTAADIKRVEAVLEFDGRIDREHWIEQAKLLAAGDEKEFLRRFPTAAGSGQF